MIMVNIRPATEADKRAVWEIIDAVIAGGDTYTFAPDTPIEGAENPGNTRIWACCRVHSAVVDPTSREAQVARSEK